MISGLTVQQVADEAGVAASTVRLYARRGLLTSRRTPSNARRFDYDAPCRIAIAKAAQRAGLDLQSITQLLAALPAHATAKDWNELNRRLTVEAERRIAMLQDVIEDLAGKSPLCALPLAPDDVQRRHTRV